MTRGGWFSLGRVVFDDPLTRPSGVWPEALALAYLAGLADRQTGEIEATVRQLAVEWSWPKSKVQRFLSALEERGWIRTERRGENPRLGQRIFASWPWDRTGTERGTESGTEKASDYAASQSIPGQNAGQNVGQNRDRVALPPPLENPPPTEGDNNRREARAWGGTPVDGEDVRRLVELLRKVGMFGVELVGRSWDQQAEVVAAMIRDHGPEVVEKAIRGAGRRGVWPFNKGEPILASDVQRHFARALGASEAPATPVAANGKAPTDAPTYRPPPLPKQVLEARQHDREVWRRRIQARLREAPKGTLRTLVAEAQEQLNLRPAAITDPEAKRRAREAVELAAYQTYGRAIGDPCPT